MHSTHKIKKYSHVQQSSRTMLMGNAIIHVENQNFTLHMVYQNYVEYCSHILMYNATINHHLYTTIYTPIKLMSF
jgi:hypothetical protein